MQRYDVVRWTNDLIRLDVDRGDCPRIVAQPHQKQVIWILQADVCVSLMSILKGTSRLLC